MAAPTLSPQLFALFSGLVEDTCGIYYGADQGLFAAKLTAHAAEVGHDSLLDYYYRLRYDDPTGVELASLIEALLVHETYFFRELPPLVQLADGHLADVVRTRGRARVWSAACSTGEEPFTLAMLLDARGVLDRVELVASDVSVSAVERARTGQHSRRALRDGHPVELAARYLAVGATSVAVAPRIRDAVTFRTLNLFDAAAIAALGSFDAILCRNVMIYFRDQQITRVIDHLAGALAPDGLLAVGVSESLLRFGTVLACEERGHAFFYRRAP
ncbi:MAG TPA: protein-glutamate O-methyltransferase CheR [Kofleriaceae bacterium]|nr:protein-glutamate O-methyltransferase CheR [Kofleriaceae bacterium]